MNRGLYGMNDEKTALVTILENTGQRFRKYLNKFEFITHESQKLF